MKEQSKLHLQLIYYYRNCTVIILLLTPR